MAPATQRPVRRTAVGGALPRALLPAILVWLPLAAVVGGALAALLARAPSLPLAELWQDAYIRQVVRFTLWQALLSTLLSLTLAIPVARALARRPRFPGRGLLLRLFGLPLVVPSIVAVFGVVAIYGHGGLFNRALSLLGAPPWQGLYGLPGILIAHVFFNLPLAVRMLLPLWAGVPGESWRLAAQLGMRSGALWRLIEWPLLRQALPGVATLIFLLCSSSFAVVLTLGGGPAASNLEVAVYQALRFEFEPGRAVALALLQMMLCGSLAWLLTRLAQPMALAASAARPYPRPDQAALGGRLWDALVLLLATLSVGLPLAAVAAAGLDGPLTAVLIDPLLWRSTLQSLAVALPAGLLALAGGLSLLLSSRRLRLRCHRPRWAEAVELSGSLVLVLPPLVLGTGLFLLLMPYADVFALGLTLVTLVNALMGLPFVIRVLSTPLRQVAEHHDRLCASLGISGWRRARLIEWPLLRRPIALALALAVTLALGDMGVIALFGSQHTMTLPYLLYQRLSSYQMEQAAVTALFLVALCLGLFLLIERGIGGRERAHA